MEQNDFLEFLQLEHGEPRLVTKSELLEQIRAQGLTISDRQLTFYVTEGLVPKSVRVGSRAGVYPKLVVQLLAWILRAREMGVPVEAIKELVPVWKFLIGARYDRVLDLAQFEYIARQKVSSLEAVLAIPELLTDVFASLCRDCQSKTQILTKDGIKHVLDEPTTTIGFAAISKRTDDSGAIKTDWFGYRRLTLAYPPEDFASDPSTVILGVAPNEPLPAMRSKPVHKDRDDGPAERNQENTAQ